MKTFKLIDSLISAVLIILAFSIALTGGNIYYCYFMVGGWQVVSMIIHEIYKWFVPEGSARSLYHRIVVWMIVVFILWAFIGYAISETVGYYILVYLYLLLVFTPVMAIFYTALCFIEWKESYPKPMAKLNN
ncbi:MAG TPA: hypothetical protein VHM26_02350 [Chitinophagaceae bacterium]|jgi:hypothetical protein|nr:hypothetical protein [Chitinophagaceae bacterium]